MTVIVKKALVIRDDFLTNSKITPTFLGLKAFLPGSGQVRRDSALKDVRS
jgi:hypothetical protein